MKNRSQLLVFSDDWGRHPSSCQHLIRNLLPDHPVIWVNTIGTRKPKFDLLTLKRGFGKIRQWFTRGSPKERETLPENLQVLNPRMWPAFANSWERKLNQNLLMRSLSPHLREPIAITTIPIVADLMGSLPVKKWVYYCVDDFSKWPGLDGRTLEKLERIVIDRSERIICVSEHLRNRISRFRSDSIDLLTHGVDLELWQKPVLPMKLDFEPPLIVFWGVIDRRLDFEFVQQLANDLTSGTILFVGPENEPDSRLFQLPRVKKLGALSFESLPALAQSATVLIMPYADLPVTRAMQPLKLKEYLATGKPCIVRDLPANREWRAALDLAASPIEFSAQVRHRLVTGIPPEQSTHRQHLEAESWSGKASLLRTYLGENSSLQTLLPAPATEAIK
jgi:glycosyltransferase involved in cell wall biosynthesis